MVRNRKTGAWQERDITSAQYMPAFANTIQLHGLFMW